MAVFNVNSTSALNTALSHAHNGDMILLAPGTYSNETINHVNFTGTVTISSQNVANQAVIANLKVVNSSGLAFSNLVLTGSHDSYAQSRVASSHNISFTNMTVHGDVNAAPSTQLNGIYVSYSTGVSITHSQFYNLDSGLVENKSQSLLDSGNSFHNLNKGGIEMGGVTGVTIKNNSFTNFDAAHGVHSDAIQIYQSAAYGASNNLKIADNLIERGSGSPMMGILLGAEAGLADNNVQISGNTVIGSNWNAITVAHGGGAVDIANNMVESWAGYDNVANKTVDYTAWIRLGNLTGAHLTLTGNSAQHFVDSTGRAFNPGAANTVLGAVHDAGASMLNTWSVTHQDLMPDMSAGVLSLLGVSPVHSFGGIGG